jgi:hypothetical protein
VLEENYLEIENEIMVAEAKKNQAKTKKDKEDEDEVEHKKPFNHAGVKTLINLH